MALKKIISIGQIKARERGIELTKDLTPNERVSLLEDLREQTYLAIKHEYPKRLRRILEVVKRGER
jgi:hypothetical protein